MKMTNFSKSYDPTTRLMKIAENKKQREFLLKELPKER
jgi:hypothetical protein